MKQKGQGSLEYLLLIAAAVLIAAVVMTLMTGNTSNTGKTTRTQYCDYLGALGAECGIKLSCSNIARSYGDFNLSAIPAGGQAPYKYSWSGTGCNFLGDKNIQSPNVNCPIGGNYTYTVKVTDSSHPADQNTCSTILGARCYIRLASHVTPEIGIGELATFMFEGGTGDANWFSSDANIASAVSAGWGFGSARGNSLGTTKISAKSAGCPNDPEMDLKVILQMCTITPPDTNILAGTTKQFSLSPYGRSGVVTYWNSNAASIASVDSNGKVTAGTDEGTAKITASRYGCLAGNASRDLAVLLQPCTITGGDLGIEVGKTTTYMFWGGDQGVSASWSSLDENTAIIRSLGFNFGLATGVNADPTSKTTVISATRPLCPLGTPVPVMLTVYQNWCTITPSSVTLELPGTTTLAFAGGTGNITWDSNASDIAAVNSSGVVTTGTKVGTAKITGRRANCRGGQATATVKVVQTLPQCTITPANIAIKTGATQQFSMNAGITPEPTWSVTGSPLIATIHTITGLATAGPSTGTVQIVGTSAGCLGGQAATNLTVTDSCIVSPQTATIAPGETLAYTVIGGTGSASGWSSTSTKIATITADGMATGGTKEGSTTISAATKNGCWSAIYPASLIVSKAVPS